MGNVKMIAWEKNTELFARHLENIQKDTDDKAILPATQEVYDTLRKDSNFCPYESESPVRSFNRDINTHYKDYGLTRLVLGKSKYFYALSNGVERGSRRTNNEFPKNRIIYGAPGTGKSRKLKNDSEKHFDPEKIKRITFYPDYSYSQFVGCYKPTPVYISPEKDKKNSFKDAKGNDRELHGTPIIDYRFVPGPFMKILASAIADPDSPYVLIIEEINRAETAAVFGDIFQSLDRDENGDSEYPIELPSEAMDWLRNELNQIAVTDSKNADKDFIQGGIRIPSNLYLWATMNSADQGVFLLDAAFKRRWSLEYLPLNTSNDVTQEWGINLGKSEADVSYLWDLVRTEINKALEDAVPNLPEDRLIGPFFMKKEELMDRKAVANKLLLYLKEDVLRHTGMEKVFNITDEKKGFSQILKKFNSDGVGVFHSDLKFGNPIENSDEIVDNTSQDEGQNSMNIDVTEENKAMNDANIDGVEE